MADYVIKRTMRGKAISGTLKDASGPINLTGSTVAFRMVNASDGTVVVNDAAATVVSAVDGTVKYDWGVGDTDTAGEYLGEWTITDGAALDTLVPSNRHITIEILDDL